GIAAHWKYKEASDGKHVEGQEEEKLIWLRQILEWQQEMADNQEFLSLLKSDLNLFSEDVYCFTPGGEVKNLPAGSTPIDFAYSIHSAVGNKMIGAKVNGTLVPIDYVIQNGDRVEILTSASSKGPSRDWLSIAKATSTKNKINQWFRNEVKDENIARGRELLIDFCKTKGLDLHSLTKPEYQELIYRRYGFKEWNQVLAAVGHGGLKEGQVVNKLLELNDRDHKKHLTDEEVLAAVAESASPARISSGGNEIIVKGVHDVAVRFSKCCNPVPGDEIVGFVTRGRGVSIHRRDCINVERMSDEDRSRLIEARWEKATGGEKYVTIIKIFATDRSGLLADISRALTEKNVDILSMNTHTSKQGLATLETSFQVSSREELKAVVDRLRTIESVIDIERSTG
ncbi:MAG: bifunctional (p)ppGpp synthetase/guanosine-3',5'-bis(diphosphate) 3'-pyrophosphohydrolase, partial [Butyrivibrio sp.]|nr:bifunctional (p)ppGpp synthetase/guanosine-3',5'-bis(diphosphate) 3'-pyrophosphohydrolase [Butyrivibrio sp.]